MSLLPTVILVPGLGGSELYTPPSIFGLGPPIKVWLGYATLVAGGWRWLGLQADGVTPTTPLTGRLQAGRPLGDYYGTFCHAMSARGYMLFSAFNDWRGVIQSDGQQLAGDIRAIADRAPIHLVAHSRGGLVTRYALADLAATGDLDLVGRVVGMGVPHYGSWSGVALAAGWDEFAVLLRRLIYGIELVVIGAINAGDLQNVLLSWPSTYAVFPSPTAPGISPTEAVTAYSASAWAAAGVPISEPWLAAASAAWAAIPGVPAGVPWLDVVGMGTMTPDHLLGSAIPRAPTDMTWSADGDGRVPARWAAWPGNTQFVTAALHGALPYSEDVIVAVDQWLRGITPGAGFSKPGKSEPVVGHAAAAVLPRAGNAPGRRLLAPAVGSGARLQ